jgi:ferredoxin
MRVLINKDLCIGCGACASLCPDNFVVEDNNRAKFIKTWGDDDVVDAKIKEGIKNATSSCPVQAISID